MYTAKDGCAQVNIYIYIYKLFYVSFTLVRIFDGNTIVGGLARLSLAWPLRNLGKVWLRESKTLYGLKGKGKMGLRQLRWRVKTPSHVMCGVRSIGAVQFYRESSARWATYASSTKEVSMHLANNTEPPSKSETESQKEEMEKIY